MSARAARPRRALLFLPVAVTVLLAVAVGGFVVVQSQEQADQIESADAAGADYLSAVATFQKQVATAVEEADQDDPAAIASALENAVQNPPALPDLDEESTGVESSSTYTEAVRVEETLLQPYIELGEELDRAEVSFTYIAAAREVLDLRVEDFVEGTLLSSSGSLRTGLIPRFVQARDELAQVPVPEDGQDVADTVTGAVQHVIDEATALANSIDANQNYTFTYADQYQAGITALENYATAVEGDLTESLIAISDLSE
ncbi:hypothetical protein [Aeromicrobium sp. CF3.5]|uniref:hypothetical protein n=1 Tax=Aeromicrobium sp. CF3.5 TaxID=3373078 RepID=UPI003EE6E47A